MDFRQYFKSRQGEMVHLLKSIVALESPTADKKAVDACSSFVLKEFRKAGARISSFPQKDIGDLHLVEYPARTQSADRGQILVLTHIDTVWPVGRLQRMPFYVSGSKLFGPGVLDMKAGLVMSIYALQTLRSLNLRPGKKISIFINSAEETGHPASDEAIRGLAKKSSLVLCLEPALPGGALKLERKGRLVVRLEARGKAAHAGSPEKGLNAIEELMTQLARLKKIRTQGTTASIGLIGGGEKANIVPASAWAVLDIRFWTTREREEIIAHFKEMKPAARGAGLKFSVQGMTPPMEKSQASTAFFERARDIASDLDIPLRGGKTGGGSDASIAAGLGLPTLDGLGPDGDGIHAEHEHLLLPSLVERTALLLRLLAEL